MKDKSEDFESCERESNERQKQGLWVLWKIKARTLSPVKESPMKDKSKDFESNERQKQGLWVLWKIKARTLSPVKDKSEDFESCEGHPWIQKES